MKTKLPTPQKLPSGNWRCQITVAGRRVSVVDETPGVAQAKAVALRAGLMEEKKQSGTLTVGGAVDRYIESKDAVLSPSTVACYKRIRRNSLQALADLKLSELTQEHVQRAINQLAKVKSPKTVRNAHGLLGAVLAEYKPDMVLRTTMPQRVRYEAAIPSDEEIDRIFAAAAGTNVELPILLALWMGMRVSEIIGLTWDSIEGDMLHIKAAIVDGEHGPVKKGTKSYSGNRKIRLPEYLRKLIEAQPRENEHIVQMSRQAIRYRFNVLCRRAGVPHYRFHDLRHANASVMLALGVPDKYSMERMGHATDSMLKTVYQHTMRTKQDAVADVVDSYFVKKLHTASPTEQASA